jgi:hypothetical protein
MGQTPGRGEYFLVRGPAGCPWTPVSHARMSRCRTTPVSPALRPRRHPILRTPWACARGIGFVFASREPTRAAYDARGPASSHAQLAPLLSRVLSFS